MHCTQLTCKMISFMTRGASNVPSLSTNSRSHYPLHSHMSPSFISSCHLSSFALPPFPHAVFTAVYQLSHGGSYLSGRSIFTRQCLSFAASLSCLQPFVLVWLVAFFTLQITSICHTHEGNSVCVLVCVRKIAYLCGCVLMCVVCRRDP